MKKTLSTALIFLIFPSPVLADNLPTSQLPVPEIPSDPGGSEVSTSVPNVADPTTKQSRRFDKARKQERKGFGKPSWSWEEDECGGTVFGPVSSARKPSSVWVRVNQSHSDNRREEKPGCS